MLVKNLYTGEKIDRDKAYIVPNGKRNIFFGNEEEYFKYIEERESNKNTSKFYIDTLSNYISFSRNVKLIAIAKRHIKQFIDSYESKYIIDTIKNNVGLLNSVNEKNFYSMMNKYLYFYKIISNKLDVGYEKYLKDKLVVNKSMPSLNKESIIIKKPKRKVNDISDFLGEE